MQFGLVQKNRLQEPRAGQPRARAMAVFQDNPCLDILGGSWVVVNGVISPLIWVISIVTVLTTPLVTAHEPPSGAYRRVDPQGVMLLGLRECAQGARGGSRMLSLKPWSF